jgi:hypothetical protein
MNAINFETIDWQNIDKLTFEGLKGSSTWQTKQYNGLRLRIVEYSEGYIADHWCKKGHIVHCIEGSFVSELDNGEQFFLNKGMTYIVSDNLSNHRSICEKGVKLLIIDGDFLQ